MEFNYFKNNISKLKNAPLGGVDTLFKLAPKIRKPYSEEYILKMNPKKAAVLALFYPNANNETNFLLTHRANYNGTHSSQISFPGGKFESSDISLKKTALREANEEIGINIPDVSILKQMTDVYIPPSNFMVTPFLGALDYIPTLIKNHEVEEILTINVSEILSSSSITTTTLSTSYAKNIEVPCFILNNHIVWGATAMMLSEIRDLLKNI